MICVLWIHPMWTRSISQESNQRVKIGWEAVSWIAVISITTLLRMLCWLLMSSYHRKITLVQHSTTDVMRRHLTHLLPVTVSPRSLVLNPSHPSCTRGSNAATGLVSVFIDWRCHPNRGDSNRHREWSACVDVIVAIVILIIIIVILLLIFLVALKKRRRAFIPPKPDPLDEGTCDIPLNLSDDIAN